MTSCFGPLASRSLAHSLTRGRLAVVSGQKKHGARRRLNWEPRMVAMKQYKGSGSGTMMVRGEDGKWQLDETRMRHFVQPGDPRAQLAGSLNGSSLSMASSTTSSSEPLEYWDDDDVDASSSSTTLRPYVDAALDQRRLHTPPPDKWQYVERMQAQFKEDPDRARASFEKMRAMRGQLGRKAGNIGKWGA